MGLHQSTLEVSGLVGQVNYSEVGRNTSYFGQSMHEQSSGVCPLQQYSGSVECLRRLLQMLGESIMIHGGCIVQRKCFPKRSCVGLRRLNIGAHRIAFIFIFFIASVHLACAILLYARTWSLRSFLSIDILLALLDNYLMPQC